MKKQIQRRDLLKMALAAIPGALAMSSCGTLIYPERRGRAGGRIDPQVVIMDGLLCLVFILPGVIAFAVDFSTGAIYTGGGSAQLQKHSVPGGTEADYNRVLAESLGKDIKLSDQSLLASQRTGKLRAQDLQAELHADSAQKAKLVVDAKGRIIKAVMA